MPRPVHIRARWHEERWIALSFVNFSSGALERLKAILPVRAFDSETKEWLFPKWALDDVVREFGSFYLDGSPPCCCASKDPRYSLLSVQPEAPNCVVKAAYKALAFEFHPDRNGGANGEKMKQLNAAFQSISRERGF